MQYRLSARFQVDATGRLLADAPENSIEAAGRHYRARDFPAAARVCDAILALRPRDFDALHLRGVLLLDEQKPAECLEYLQRARQERDDIAQVHFNIGNALLALKRHGEAADAFRRSLALQPDDPDTLNNLGNALSADLRYDEALSCLHRALALRPGAPQPLYNIARVMLGLERLEEAAELLEQALAAAGPDVTQRRFVDIYTSLSDVRVRQCRYQEALAVCRSVPEAIADSPAVRWNESLTLLILGDYAEGWRKYECRFLVADHDPPREGASVLQLDAVAGRRVLVFPEQGRGDMIQFARYLPLLAARGAAVTVEMYADLAPLFQVIEGVGQVVSPDDPPPEHDLLTPLLSLPSAFGTLLDTIPARVPYLSVPQPRQAKWSALLGNRTRPRIGLAWWGSQHIAKRSMPLATLAPVLERRDVEFHALQKEITPEDRAWIAAYGLIADHSAAVADFADTAALIEMLDLVISIDTSVAHLAGALAKPVWIMLPFSPDWRWLTQREDSPWYPTARLFRQQRAGDWEDVVRRVAAALADTP